MEVSLSKKDREFREYALKGNLWSIVFTVCTPLALYQSLNQIFRILDSMMASHISAASVSAVSYLSQISAMLASVGAGLAVGSSIKISEAYGVGDYSLVKKRVNGLYGLCFVLSGLVLGLILPFTTKFLEIANTPPELIVIGRTYFIVELIGMVIGFFNNIYIAVERARGNGKRILNLNLISIVVKLSLTGFFVYILKTGVTMIAVATIISNLVIFIASIVNLYGREDAFGVNRTALRVKKVIVAPMIHLSIPVIVEKVAFALGKVVINSMSTIYGVSTVGALGISNNIGGLTTSPQNGIQEGGASIISQNLGASQPKRALDTFKIVMIINVAIGAVGMLLTLVFLTPISNIFAGNDMEFAKLIYEVYFYEAFGAIPLGINAAVMALLYGFGYTKHTLVINFSRVFVFRIPVLFLLQNFTNVGNKSVGLVMLISNTAVTIMAIVVGVMVIKRIKKEYDI